jgi:hypothetical protein
MKQKNIKYNEAIIRNIEHAKKSKKYLNSELNLGQLKTYLGIRKNDDSRDTQILNLIGT